MRKLNPGIKYSFVGLLIMFFSSCEWSNHTIDKDYYNQNFDDLHGWAKKTELAGGHAHSGIFSTYADSLCPVSQTFEMDMRLAYYLGYKKFEASAWFFKDEKKTSGTFVASLATTDSVIVKMVKVELEEPQFRKQAWIRADLSIDIPPGLPDTDRLRIFLWSPNGTKIYMDDIVVHGIR